MRSQAKQLFLRATNNLQDSSLSAAPQNDTLGGFFNKLLEESIAKKYHAKALETLAKAHRKNPTDVPQIKPFEPYCLRHTALTWLSPHCDAFTLARIAGHSSITITQRYGHPQADAVEAAFQKMASSAKLVTHGGYHQKAQLPNGEANGAQVEAVPKG